MPHITIIQVPCMSSLPHISFTSNILIPIPKNIYLSIYLSLLYAIPKEHIRPALDYYATADRDLVRVFISSFLCCCQCAIHRYSSPKVLIVGCTTIAKYTAICACPAAACWSGQGMNCVVGCIEVEAKPAATSLTFFSPECYAMLCKQGCLLVHFCPFFQDFFFFHGCTVQQVKKLAGMAPRTPFARLTFSHPLRLF